MNIEVANELRNGGRLIPNDQNVIDIDSNNDEQKCIVKEEHGSVNFRVFESQLNERRAKLVISCLWRLLKSINGLVQFCRLSEMQKN